MTEIVSKEYKCETAFHLLLVLSSALAAIVTAARIGLKPFRELFSNCREWAPKKHDAPKDIHVRRFDALLILISHLTGAIAKNVVVATCAIRAH